MRNAGHWHSPAVRVRRNRSAGKECRASFFIGPVSLAKQGKAAEEHVK
ncbi:hypothetical protein [Vibrio aerogenes]|nr:hypothetical protein [Vibrio aerogenes]